MIVQHDDRAISHRQRCERTERSATTSASHGQFRRPEPMRLEMRSRYTGRTRNNSVGRNHVEIFVRRMWYKGCHQAHNAKVVLALTAAKSPQRLTRHLATPPAVSSIGGLRTPAPVRAAPPSWAGIRKPSRKRTQPAAWSEAGKNYKRRRMSSTSDDQQGAC